MDYRFQCESLQNNALVAIARSMWLGSDWLRFRDSGNRWRAQQIYETTQKAFSLLLPAKFQRPLSVFIELTCHQIYQWFRQLEHDLNDFDLGVKNFDKIVWSNSGIIDRQRTAELIVRDPSNDLRQRFQLACVHFLHNDILLLKTELSQTHVTVEELVCSVPISSYKFIEIFFGPGYKIPMPELSELLIDVSADAFQFLLQQYITNEREAVLREAIHFMVRKHSYDLECFTDIYCNIFCDSVVNKLCIFLPQLNDEERQSLFRERADKILICFLQYPGQQKFFPMLREVAEFMSPEKYHFVLNFIIYKIHLDFTDYDYQHMFKVLWEGRTRNFQKYRIFLCSRIDLWESFHSVQKMSLLELQLIHKCFKDTEVWNDFSIYLTDCLEMQAENMHMHSLESFSWLLNQLKHADHISEQERSLNFSYGAIIDILIETVKLVLMRREALSFHKSIVANRKNCVRLSE